MEPGRPGREKREVGGHWAFTLLTGVSRLLRLQGPPGLEVRSFGECSGYLLCSKPRAWQYQRERNKDKRGPRRDFGPLFLFREQI